jgi:hypothetical protein
MLHNLYSTFTVELNNQESKSASHEAITFIQSLHGSKIPQLCRLLSQLFSTTTAAATTTIQGIYNYKS